MATIQSPQRYDRFYFLSHPRNRLPYCMLTFATPLMILLIIRSKDSRTSSQKELLKTKRKKNKEVTHPNRKRKRILAKKIRKHQKKLRRLVKNHVIANGDKRAKALAEDLDLDPIRTINKLEVLLHSLFYWRLLLLL